MADNRASLADIIQRVPVSRRGFISRVVAGTFVAPVVSSATVATIFGSRGLAAAGQPFTTGPFTSRPFASGPACAPIPCGSGPGIFDLMASADSFLRKSAENTNEGGNLRLRVGVSPISRAVIAFDANTVNCRIVNARSVHLIVTIAANHNTWGQGHPRSVVAHPLTMTFLEGNGLQALMPDSLAQRGTGSGVTWRSPDDPDVSNRRVNPRHHAVLWNGGAFGPATAAPAPHENLQMGTVEFDVTADVLSAAASGWLLKIDHEHAADDDDHDNLAPGSEPALGVIEYHSIQGAQSLFDASLAPTLRFFY